MRILLVDDHRETRSVIEGVLKSEGHTVDSADSLTAARDKLAGGSYAGVILDWILPDGSGIDLCRELRGRGESTPVLMLTARGEVEDRVSGLDAGADDYLRKPFAIAELKARVRALLRRGPQLEQPIVRIGSAEIRLASRGVFVGGREIPVTAREFDILDVLARHRGRAVARSAILLAIWGAEDDSARASLEVLVARLRRKMADAGGPDIIRTHRGYGYSLSTEP